MVKKKNGTPLGPNLDPPLFTMTVGPAWELYIWH